MIDLLNFLNILVHITFTFLFQPINITFSFPLQPISHNVSKSLENFSAFFLFWSVALCSEK